MAYALSHLTEQIDEGLAGKQRQFEGWIHNLNKELNHYKAVNVELSNKLKELCHPKEHAKGKCTRNLMLFFLTSENHSGFAADYISDYISDYITQLT